MYHLLGCIAYIAWLSVKYEVVHTTLLRTLPQWVISPASPAAGNPSSIDVNRQAPQHSRFSTSVGSKPTRTDLMLFPVLDRSDYRLNGQPE